MKSATVSTKLEPSISEKLDLLAKATARSRSFLVAEAIETYVKDQAWQKEANNDNFATDKEVKKAFKNWGVNED